MSHATCQIIRPTMFAPIPIALIFQVMVLVFVGRDLAFAQVCAVVVVFYSFVATIQRLFATFGRLPSSSSLLRTTLVAVGLLLLGGQFAGELFSAPTNSSGGCVLFCAAEQSSFIVRS
jgi:hypothetical protein